MKKNKKAQKETLWEARVLIPRALLEKIDSDLRLQLYCGQEHFSDGDAVLMTLILACREGRGLVHLGGAQQKKDRKDEYLKRR